MSSLRGVLFNGRFLRLIEQIRCPGHPSGASWYPAGAKCHIRCRGGFRLEGAHARHCVTGGQWDGEEPICLREVVTNSFHNSSNSSLLHS